MVTATQLAKHFHRLVIGGIVVVPACAVYEVPDHTAHYAPLTPQAIHARKSVTAQRELIPVGASSTEDSNAQPKPLTIDEPVPPAPTRIKRPTVPAAATQGKPLPINLPTALALSGANPLDIQIAEERLNAAVAAQDRANVLWLPNIALGVDYFRHDGQIQDVAGTVFTTSRSSLLLGGGPNAVFAVSEAIYAPLVAQQVVQARQAEIQIARNDTTARVAEAYFNVQQARGEVAGAIDCLRRADELVQKAEKLAPELTPTVEVNRTKAEAARRRQAVENAYERWQVAAAELTRLLRLEMGTLTEPAEEPSLTVDLIDAGSSVDELVQIALTHRPELTADQATIQAAIARVRQEQVRPFIPNIAIRGVGSNTPGLAGGYFGGGINSNMKDFSSRFSVDVQAVWELQNLGLGNSALVREREAERQQALLQLLRTQDSVTADVVQAHTRLKRANTRLKAAESGLTDAVESAEKNVLGLGQTKRVGEQIVLVFRPQEVVASITALDLAYRDYYTAVGDYNRAQFQLYRALGHPAQSLGSVPTPPTILPGTNVFERSLPPVSVQPPVRRPEDPVSVVRPANAIMRLKKN